MRRAASLGRVPGKEWSLDVYRVPLIRTGGPIGATRWTYHPPGLIDELVPRHTAVVDEIVVRFEDAVRQPVVTQELPDVFRPD